MNTLNIYILRFVGKIQIKYGIKRLYLKNNIIYNSLIKVLSLFTHRH